MKLVAGMIVSSDAKFLRYSLASIRTQVDHVVIVEGCDVRWVQQGNANADGSSLDNTSDIITRERDSPDTSLAPVMYVPPRVYPHRNAQRQICLDAMAAVGADICLLVDADEFYDVASIQRLRSYFDDATVICAAFPFFNFYTFVRRFSDTSPMERCFRFAAGMRYPDIESGQYVITADGRKIWDMQTNAPGVVCYHYNKVQDPKRVIEKMRFYFERDSGLDRASKITLDLLSEDDRYALTKDSSGGQFMPLISQPTFARFLIFSDIAPMTSLCSLSDIAGINWPTANLSLSDVPVEGLEWRTDSLRLSGILSHGDIGLLLSEASDRAQSISLERFGEFEIRLIRAIVRDSPELAVSVVDETPVP